MSVLRESVPLKPFLNLTFFPFLPPHLPEEDPQHRAEEKGQEEAAVHQTIFQPSLGFPRPQKKKKSVSHQEDSESKSPTNESGNYRR